MRKLVLIGVLGVLAIGCAKPQSTLAGGKPVSFWLEALDNADARLRKTAVTKLGNVGSSDPAAYPAVVTALGDKDAGVRREAILSLLKFGDAARGAVLQLSELRQHDRDRRVRDYAARAVEYLRASDGAQAGNVP